MLLRRTLSVLLVLACGASLLSAWGCHSLFAQGSYARLAHAQVELLAEGPRTQIQAAVQSSADPAARSEALWKAAQQFEHDEDFQSALVAYQEIARAGACSAESVKKRINWCRARLAVESRWSDPALRREAAEMDASRGLGLLREVARTVVANYVDEISYGTLLEGGLENLRAALASEKFRRQWNVAGDGARRDAFLAALNALERELAEEREPTSFTVRYYARRACEESRRTVGLPDGLIISEFIFGAAEHLDDYTMYLTHYMYQTLLDDLSGRLVGLGVEVARQDGRLTVLGVFAGGPAEKAGFLVGDDILAVNGHAVAERGMNEVVRLLRGERGSSVNVTVQRGQESRTFTVVRQAIDVPSVRGVARLGPGDSFGYLRLAGFQRSTGSEVAQALDRLERGGTPAGLVLDLRDNSGGLLDAAVDVCDLFIEQGTALATVGRGLGQTHTYRVSHWRLAPHGAPLVVLVNGSSASAAEIVAAALKENHRATLVGSRTFGKGIVQSVLPVECGLSAVYITTARFHGPSGVSFHGLGIAPDVAVDSPRSATLRAASPDLANDPALRKALEVLSAKAAAPQAAPAALAAEPVLSAAAR